MESIIYELLRSDGSITTNKNLIRAIGLQEAVLYSELLSRYFYFKDKGQLQADGSFFNVSEDLQDGTGLSEKQQRSLIKKLKLLGLINVKVKGLPARRYFYLTATDEILTKLITQGKEIHQLRQKVRTRTYKIAEPDVTKGKSNNTNFNNTNSNNTKNLHHLNELKDVYVSTYIEIADMYGYKSKRATTDNLNYIQTSINTIREYIDIDNWIIGVKEHFENLPKNNDGDIVCFLKASSRYFEINLEAY